MSENSSTPRAEPANLPAVRASAVVATRSTPAVPVPVLRLGPVPHTAMIATLFAFPLAGLLVALI